MANFAAFYEGSDGQEGLVRGLAWLLARTTSQVGVIVVPTKSGFEGNMLEELVGTLSSKRLAKGEMIQVDGRRLVGATLKTFPPPRWTGGPVLALWLNTEELGKLRTSSVTALCVVPWGGPEACELWIKAHQATNLLSGVAASGRGISDPVVEAALVSLTDRINLWTGLVHPRDKSAAVEAFQILRRAGYRWDPDELYVWALGRDWTAEGAAQLKDVARGVQEGRRFKTGSASWAHNIIEIWKSP